MLSFNWFVVFSPYCDGIHDLLTSSSHVVSRITCTLSSSLRLASLTVDDGTRIYSEPPRLIILEVKKDLMCHRTIVRS